MTQLRRTIDSALGTLLDSASKLVIADVFTITLSDGTTVLKWTSFDRPVTIGADTWLPGPGLRSSKLKWTAGIEVDTLTLDLNADASTLINGQPLMPFINGGGLDWATVVAYRAYAADLAAPNVVIDWVSKLHRFTGKVSDIDRPSRVDATISVRSIFELMNQQLPRNVYQPDCLNSVYDNACLADRTSKTVTAAVTTGTDGLRLTFTASSLTQAPGYFSLGAVRFTSGPNAGVMRTVRSHSAGGMLTLVQPLPVAAGSGDGISIYPGCDKTLATCQVKFSNVVHFRGHPWIPVAETVL